MCREECICFGGSLKVVEPGVEPIERLTYTGDINKPLSNVNVDRIVRAEQRHRRLKKVGPGTAARSGDI